MTKFVMTKKMKNLIRNARKQKNLKTRELGQMMNIYQALIINSNYAKIK